MVPKRRILVSMSLSATPRSVEYALTSLWTRESAEITGLFIEDLEVLNLSLLPVSREVRYEDASSRVPDAADMERQIRAHGRRVRAAFENRAHAMNVASSFRVTRGPLTRCLLEACAGFDVLVVASARDRMGQRLSLRMQIPELLASGPRTLVIVQEPPASAGCIAAVYQDSAGGRAALQMATDIARADGLALAVLLPAADEAQQASLRAQAAEIVGDYPAASYHRLGGPGSATDIATATARAAARLLVLPRDDSDPGRQLALDVIGRIGCSVILTG